MRPRTDLGKREHWPTHGNATTSQFREPQPLTNAWKRNHEPIKGTATTDLPVEKRPYRNWGIIGNDFDHYRIRFKRKWIKRKKWIRGKNTHLSEYSPTQMPFISMPLLRLSTQFGTYIFFIFQPSYFFIFLWSVPTIHSRNHLAKIIESFAFTFLSVLIWNPKLSCS